MGVASCGDTTEEALSNLKEAVELYLDNAKALGIIVDVEPALTSPHKFTMNDLMEAADGEAENHEAMNYSINDSEKLPKEDK